MAPQLPLVHRFLHGFDGADPQGFQRRGEPGDDLGAEARSLADERRELGPLVSQAKDRADDGDRLVAAALGEGGVQFLRDAR